MNGRKRHTLVALAAPLRPAPMATHTLWNESSLPMNNIPFLRTLVCMATALAISPSTVSAAELRAGVAKVDITDRAAGPVNDPLFAKVLVAAERNHDSGIDYD